MTIGRKHWAIAEGYIPPDDPAKPRALISHEAACLLNANGTDAHIKITIYFSDRAPAGPYDIKVPAQRTLHLRFNDLDDPETIPPGVDFSSVIESNVPIVVQHTRLDTRHGAYALLSTIAYGEIMKTVYITGASAGLGRAIADVYARSDYKVGLIARDENALADAAAAIGHGAVWAAADVADFGALEAAAQKLETVIGPPDIWINDAMSTIFSRFADIRPEEFSRVIDVTLLGSVHGMQIALKYMKAAGRGHVIQIGSALAYRAIPLQSAYCAAKMAVRGAVDSLRCELLHDKSEIRVTMVHMPAMNTPQFDWARRHIAEQPQPVPPIYAPEACAEAVLWAARHPGRREVWVGAPTFEAIVANRFFPALMDYYMARRAFGGQFEKPASAQDADGNLFVPVDKFHKAEGHFSDRQIKRVFWIGTCWWQELLMGAGALIILALLVVAAFRG